MLHLNDKIEKQYPPELSEEITWANPVTNKMNKTRIKFVSINGRPIKLEYQTINIQTNK